MFLILCFNATLSRMFYTCLMGLKSGIMARHGNVENLVVGGNIRSQATWGRALSCRKYSISTTLLWEGDNYCRLDYLSSQHWTVNVPFAITSSILHCLVIPTKNMCLPAWWLSSLMHMSSKIFRLNDSIVCQHDHPDWKPSNGSHSKTGLISTEEHAIDRTLLPTKSVFMTFHAEEEP